MRSNFLDIFFLTCCILGIATSCSRVCYLQEIDEFGNEVNSSERRSFDSRDNRERKGGGYERFKMFLDGTSTHNTRFENPEQTFKVRFCNYMLGYRNDDPKELAEIAKNISSSYKRRRMYDAASKFDSYRDVLIYGQETIPESWDDTTDLLEEFRRNVAIKKHKEYCAQKKLEKSKMSFWEKLFGKSEKKAACDYLKGNETFDPYNSGDTMTPTVIMAPPGYYNYRGESELIENTRYVNQPKSCSACSVGRGNVSAATYSNSNANTTIEGAKNYF